MEIHSNAWLFQNTTTVGNGAIHSSGRADQVTIFITGDSISRTVYFEGSDNDGNWFPLPAVKLPELTTASLTTGNNESWVINISNFVSVRTRVSAIAGGTVKITGRVTETGATILNSITKSNLQINDTDISELNPIPTKFNSKIATGGSNTTIIDLTQNFETDTLIGSVAEVTIDNTTYHRTITSNTSNTITIADLPGTIATARLGAPEAGEVTITTVLKGVGGNEYDVEVVLSPGQNAELSASLTGLMLTVYLGTDAGGVADDAKNTDALIATAIDQVPEFNATATGAGGVIAVTVEPVPFTGGTAVVTVGSGDVYKINENILNYVDFTFHNESIAINAGNSFTVGTYKMLTVNIYGTSATRTVNFKCTSFSGLPIDIQGVKVGTSTTAITTEATSEVWQFGIEGLHTIFFGLSAVAGGNVTIKGRASR